MKLPAYSKSIGLYIHIPFCRSKCIYCAFYSITDTSPIEDFIKALKREADLYQEQFRGRRFSTIYIGGGTPSILEPDQISEILQKIFESFDFEDSPEITIEANPESVDLEKAVVWRKLGINRVSLGVQSANDEELKFLGRIHDTKTASRAIEILKKAGFTNISVDLIFGIPGQSVESFKKSIEWVAERGVTHISTYSLTVEKGTKLFELSKRIRMPDEETIVKFYRIRDETLERLGFRRYEISNFARPGFESAHNRIYWFHGEYLGLGPSAASFLYKPQPIRWQNRSNLRAYIKNLWAGKFPPLEKDVVSRDKLLLERIFLYIRTDRGLPCEFKKIVVERAPELSRFFEDSSGRLNFEGMLIADTLALQIYEAIEPLVDEIELD